MEKPLLSHRKTLFRWIQLRVKEAIDHRWRDSRSLHRVGKARKQRKTTDKTEASKGRLPFIAFSALCLTQSYFSVLTTTPNNQRQGLMGQVPTLGTPIRRRKTTIKRGVKRNKRRGGGTPNISKAPEKLLGSSRGPTLSSKLSPSHLDREEHCVNRCPYTKAQLFGPLSTNSLYWAHCSKVPCILDLA